jgi:hypothetical protein
MVKLVVEAQAEEALTWAICKANRGAGKGGCDPVYCGCAGEAKDVLRALNDERYGICRQTAADPLLLQAACVGDTGGDW